MKLKKFPSWVDNVRNVFESSEHTKLSEKLNAIISSNRDTATTTATKRIDSSSIEEIQRVKMDETTKLAPPTQPIRIKSILKNPSSSSASLSTMETTKGSIKTSTSHLHRHHRLDCSASSSITTATNLTSTSLPDETTSSFRTTDDFIKSLTASDHIGRVNRQRKRIASQPPRNFLSVNPTTVASGVTTVANRKKRAYKRTYPEREKTVELITFFGKFK